MNKGALLAVLAGLGALIWSRSASASMSRPVLRQADPGQGYGERLASYMVPSGGGFVPTSGGFDAAGRPIWEVAKNPGNLRYNKANDWVGQVGEYKGFAAFSAFEYGIRAMSIVIAKDVRAGKTLRQIVNEYAPPHENDSAAYLQRVAVEIGVAPDRVPDMSQLTALVRAMIRVETGQDFDMALVSRGVSMMAFA